MFDVYFSVTHLKVLEFWCCLLLLRGDASWVCSLRGFHGDVENKESSRWYVASESRATLFLFHSRFITVFTLKFRPHRAAYFIARLNHSYWYPCVTPPLYCLSICIDRSLPWMDSSGEHSLPRIDRIHAALRLFVCCAVLVIECIALPHSEA